MAEKKNNSLQEALIFILLTLGGTYLVFWGPIAFFQIPTISFIRPEHGPARAIFLFLTGVTRSILYNRLEYVPYVIIALLVVFTAGPRYLNRRGTVF